MINVQDLIKLKTDNEVRIAENDAVICEKHKANAELEAENRVFDKLIMLFNTPETDNTHENLETIEN